MKTHLELFMLIAAKTNTDYKRMPPNEDGLTAITIPRYTFLCKFMGDCNEFWFDSSGECVDRFYL